MPAAKNEFQKLMDQVRDFVAKQKGNWEHADWEKCCQQVEKLGYGSSDELKRNLGNLLESAKYFYQAVPGAAEAAPKKAPAKKKAPTKRTT